MLNHNEIVKAIQFIRPNAGFVMRGEEIEWLSVDEIEPTKAEIEAGWIAYQAKLAADQAEAAAKKTAALSKLEKLGLTVDDLKALDLA